MHGSILLAAVFVIASLVAPAIAAAATQVSTDEVVVGREVVVVTDDGTGGEIQVTRGIDSGTTEPFVAVDKAGGANTADPACQEIGPVVTCAGEFDQVLVRGNGGGDEITLDLILDGQPPLLAEVFGGTGNDTLKTPADSREVPQPETLLSGELGDDTIEGGNGVDDLRGGEGNDTLRGFGGSDFLLGEEGDDSIFARDGISDLIECGTGSDTAEVDPVDALDATCESVLGLPPAPVPPPPTPPAAAPLSTFGAQTLVTLELAAPRIPAAGPLRVRIENANAFAVSGELGGEKKVTVTSRKKPASASRQRTVRLKAKPFSLGANAEAVVKLALPAALRQSLKDSGKLALKLSAEVRDPAGATRPVSRWLTPKLKQPKPKPR